MRCPGGIKLEFPLLAVSLSVCVFCAFPAGYVISSINQIQGVLVPFMNNSLHEHYAATPSRPTLLLVWGVFAASNYVGDCTMAWFAYPLKRRFGCKKTLFLLGCGSLSIGAITKCVAKYACSMELLIVGMFTAGVGFGLILNTLGPTYLSECSPPGLRGFTAMALVLGFYTGVLVAFILGLPAIMGTEELWGLYLLPPAVFSAAGMLVSPWLPDSPKDLYTTLNDKPTARRTVRFLYGDEQHDVDAVLADFDEEHHQTKGDFRIVHLLTEHHLRRALIVALLVNALAATCGPSVVLYFSHGIFLNLGLPESDAGSLTIALVPLVPALTPLAAVLIERVGRRKMLLGSGFASSATLGLYALCGTLAVRCFPGATWLKYVAAVSILVNFWFLPFSPITIAQFLPTELFPHHARTAAIAAASVVLTGCAIVTTTVFPSLLDVWGPLAVIVVFIGPSLVFLVALWWLMPETAGRPVNQIVRDFIDETETRRVARLPVSGYGSLQTTDCTGV